MSLCLLKILTKTKLQPNYITLLQQSSKWWQKVVRRFSLADLRDKNEWDRPTVLRCCSNKAPNEVHKFQMHCIPRENKQQWRCSSRNYDQYMLLQSSPLKHTNT